MSKCGLQTEGKVPPSRGGQGRHSPPPLNFCASGDGLQLSAGKGSFLVCLQSPLEPACRNGLLLLEAGPLLFE